MHGDEIVGRELMVLLIREIALGYRILDPKIVNLVNNLEIFIVPSMNPDGADYARRGNSRWVDLNRDFLTLPPEIIRTHPTEGSLRPKQSWSFKQIETSLSANFHGGAEVNYPWTHQEKSTSSLPCLQTI